MQSWTCNASGGINDFRNQPDKDSFAIVKGRFAKKTTILTVVGLAVGLTFLLLAFRNTDLAAIGDAFRSANLLYVPLVLLALVLFFWIKTVRWALLLTPLRKIPSAQLFPLTVIGYASNILLPAQLGELVRSYLVSNKCGLPAGPVLVTVILERMFDFLTILLFVAILVPLVPNTPDVLILAAKICGGIGAALLSGALLGATRPQFVTRLFHIATRWLPGAISDPLGRQFTLAIRGLQSLTSFKMLIALSGWSIVQWLLMGLCTWFAILAFDIDVPVSAAYVVLAVVVVGMTIPNSPGFFGTMQLCFTIGLGAFGVPAGMAIAASVLFHATVFISVGVGGIFFTHRMGYTTAELVRESGIDNKPDISGS